MRGLSGQHKVFLWAMQKKKFIHKTILNVKKKKYQRHQNKSFISKACFKKRQHIPLILHFQANVLQQGQQSTTLSVISSISCSNAGYYRQGGHIGRDMVLMGGLGGTTAVAVAFFCLFWRMEQKVRKVAIWWVFISR